MIHLDTNLLIYLADQDPTVVAWADKMAADDQDFRVSCIAWYEFLTGPVSDEKVSRIKTLINSEPIPFGASLAKKAAELFNLTGRARKRKTDTMIAATAILHGGKLATRNIPDFQCFESLGLELIEV